MADELNLDVDTPDMVAGVLSAAASAYQASAVELSAAQIIGICRSCQAAESSTALA